MVAGLENLFFHRSSDQADISFKFRVVGSAYYAKYVTDDFLSQYEDGARKLNPSEIKELLGLLYSLRSAIAHGKGGSYSSGKSTKLWKRLFEILHVAETDPTDRSKFYSHVLLSLGILQKHIFALISCSKDQLAKGLKSSMRFSWIHNRLETQVIYQNQIVFDWGCFRVSNSASCQKDPIVVS